MNRRLILILGALAVLLVVMGGLLFMAYRKQHQDKQPVIVKSSIKKVLDESVVAPVGSFDGSAIWYFNREGRLFRVNTDGSGLSEFALPSLNSDLKNVVWPKSGSDFIAISTSSGQESKSYFDSAQKLYVKLPDNVKYLDWMPDGKRVVYVWQSTDGMHQSLVMANADGSGFKTVKDLFWPDLAVKVSPDGKKALLYRTKIEGDTNKIYLIDLDSGQFDTVVPTGKNLAAYWISANNFLFSQAAITAYPKIFFYSLTSKAATDLEISTTLDKTVVDKDGKYLYAAIPKKDNTGDNFVKLDLNSTKQESYFEPEQDIRGTNLMLLGNVVYFSNTRDGKLYTISK